MKWSCKTFDELNVHELYQILKLRIDIFVVEQNCPWPDLDNLDQIARHVFVEQQGKIAAYARLVPPLNDESNLVLGRIVVIQSARGQNLGRELMRRSIELAGQLWPGAALKIGAQLRLEKFYRDFGFVPMNDPYDDLGIMHIDMILKKLQKVA